MGDIPLSRGRTYVHCPEPEQCDFWPAGALSVLGPGESSVGLMRTDQLSAQGTASTHCQMCRCISEKTSGLQACLSSLTAETRHQEAETSSPSCALSY